jgi:hypothetical protein
VSFFLDHQFHGWMRLVVVKEEVNGIQMTHIWCNGAVLAVNSEQDVHTVGPLVTIQQPYGKLW